MNRYFFIFLTVFFIGFNGNAQTKAQNKTLKKFSKTYKVGKVQDGVFSIQTKKDKLYGLATIDGEILIEPKFKWISNQNKAGHYITAMQRRTSGNDGGGSFLLGLRDLAIYNKLGKQVNVDNLDGIELLNRGGGEYEDDYLRTFKNSSGKMGLLNGSGKIVIEPKYDFIGSPNSMGLGYLFDNNAYGIYNLKNNTFGPLSNTPPVSSHDIKNGFGFKGANQPALGWVIQNGYAITSKDGTNFGLLNYNTGDLVFPEEYGYKFEQQQVNYVDENNTIAKAVLIKAKNTDRCSLYDSRTNTIFFDGTGFDDVWFFNPRDSVEWASVSKGYKKNLYNIKTKTFLKDEFQEGIFLLSNDVAGIKDNDGIKMYSLTKNDYLNDEHYDDIVLVRSAKIGSRYNVIKGPDFYFSVKRGKKYGVVDEFGFELTKIIYDNSPTIRRGIISEDKTKLLEDCIILDSSQSFNTGGKRWSESRRSVLNVQTGTLVLEKAHDILYDGEYLIRVEHERDPVTNVLIKYYTAFTPEGRKVSEDRAYKL